MGRVTIYDIAADVGVSTATVSRALNGSALIGADTVRAIEAAAKRMGYHKRTIRRQAGRGILNIRVILPRRTERVQQLFYDYAALLAGITAGLHGNRANLVTDVEDDDLDLFAHKKGGDVDGVIFAFTRPAAGVYKQLTQREIPSLTLHRIVEGHDYITCDNAGGMRRLVAELVDRQPRLRPCFLRLEPAGEIADQRESGVRDACREMRVRFTSRDVISVDTIAAVNTSLARRIMWRGYTAVLCFNDVVAAAFDQAARSARVDIPGDIEITGFDNSPLRDLMRPRPDTISLPIDALGRRAGEWIAERIVKRSAEPFCVDLPGEYVPGDWNHD